jgi:hypothetical protein
MRLPKKDKYLKHRLAALGILCDAIEKIIYEPDNEALNVSAKGVVLDDWINTLDDNLDF